MIVGIGVDIIEVNRIKAIAEKNPRFLEKIFTTIEIEYCQGKKNSHQHLAARFAAKEAFFKALGYRIGWREVGVVNLPSGKPRLDLRTKKKLPFSQADVSISHLEEYAIATVILEK